MKKSFIYNLIFILSVWLIFCFPAAAQEQMPPADEAPHKTGEKHRPRLLEQLNLTPEQIQQIRRINQDRKPLVRAAQERLREANHNLDRAVYADSINETEILNLVKAVQSAQNELTSLRSATELEVRKVLTPEQIVRFREMREKFAGRMKHRQGETPDGKMNLRKDPNRMPKRNLNNRRLPRINH